VEIPDMRSSRSWRGPNGIADCILAGGREDFVLPGATAP
jgi:hypothetical protein